MANGIRETLFIHLVLLATRCVVGQDLNDVDSDTTTFQCSPCPAGYAVKAVCSSVNDTICTECPLGTYNAYESRDAVCEPCKACPDGYFALKLCSFTEDTTCQHCMDVEDKSLPDYIRKCTTNDIDDSDKSIDDTANEVDSEESLITDFIPVATKNNNIDTTNVVTQEDVTGEDENGSTDMYNFEYVSNNDVIEDSSGEGSGDVLLFTGDDMSTIFPSDFETTTEPQQTTEDDDGPLLGILPEKEDELTTEQSDVSDIQESQTTMSVDTDDDDNEATSSAPVVDIEDTESKHSTASSIGDTDIEEIDSQTTQSPIFGIDDTQDTGKKPTTEAKEDEDPETEHTTESDPLGGFFPVDKSEEETGMQPKLEHTTESDPLGGFFPVDKSEEETGMQPEVEEKDGVQTTEAQTERGGLLGGFGPIRKVEGEVVDMEPPKEEATTEDVLSPLPVEDDEDGFMWPVLVCIVAAAVILFTILCAVGCMQHKKRKARRHDFKKGHSIPLDTDEPLVRTPMIGLNEKPPPAKKAAENGQRSPIYTGNRQNPNAPKYSLLNGNGTTTPTSNLTPSKKRRPFGASIEFQFMDDASDNELEKCPPSEQNPEFRPPNRQSVRNLVRRFLSTSDIQDKDETPTADSKLLEEDNEYIPNGKPLKANSAEFIDV